MLSADALADAPRGARGKPYRQSFCKGMDYGRTVAIIRIQAALEALGYRGRGKSVNTRACKGVSRRGVREEEFTVFANSSSP
jgi:hypothetical protein